SRHRSECRDRLRLPGAVVGSDTARPVYDAAVLVILAAACSTIAAPITREFDLLYGRPRTVESDVAGTGSRRCLSSHSGTLRARRQPILSNYPSGTERMRRRFDG